MLGFKIITKLKLGLKLSRRYCYLPLAAEVVSSATHNGFSRIHRFFISTIL